ncbi:hypothetical protein OAL35_01030 [bacterium]|nr:hypothetical protein [bacterium]
MSDLNRNSQKESANTPTPNQIARRSAAIRRRWSEQTKRRRSSEDCMRWQPPRVVLTEILFDQKMES